jgi:hypothetical protein
MNSMALLSYPVHVHSNLRPLRQGLVHVGLIIWEGCHTRSLPSGADLSVPVFFPARSPSLCLASPDRQLSSRCLACPLFSLCAVGLLCQFRLLRARRGSARAHSRTSPGFSATTPAHAPSSFFRAPPVPRAHPSPHFTHLRPLSRTALAASRRRRPALAFPTVQHAGDRAKPSRAPSRGGTSVPVPNFPYCALCSSNFALVGARPRRSAVLARWSADLVWFSSLE